MTTVRTPIVDKNGKATAVWKNADAAPKVNPAVVEMRKFGVDGAYEYAASVLEEDEYLAEHVLPILDEFKALYGEPECGRTRAVFDMGNGYVAKVPLDYDGMSASRNELSSFTTEDAFIPVAECYFSDKFEEPILIMEKVNTKHGIKYSELPDWVGYVDCGQVGYDRKGNLVAYDL